MNAYANNLRHMAGQASERGDDATRIVLESAANEIDRLRDLVRTLVENDPQEPISDASTDMPLREFVGLLARFYKSAPGDKVISIGHWLGEGVHRNFAAQVYVTVDDLRRWSETDK